MALTSWYKLAPAHHHFVVPAVASVKVASMVSANWFSGVALAKVLAN